MRVRRVTSLRPVVVEVAAHIMEEVSAMAAMALRARLAFWGSSTRGAAAAASSVAPYCFSMVCRGWCLLRRGGLRGQLVAWRVVGGCPLLCSLAAFGKTS